MIFSLFELMTNEYGLSDIPREDWVRAYVNKINDKRDNLLVNVTKNKDYRFILGNEIKEDNRWDFCMPNKCETNAFLYIKMKMKEGKDNFFPVGGYGFENVNLFPVEHWWVYDKSKDEFLEVTPLQGEKFRCYAGVINFDINKDIEKANKFYDVDFFKGGYVHNHYFK